MSRSVRLILCATDGSPLGALSAFDVETPWWPDVEPVVAAARERYGIHVVILRLVQTESEDSAAQGGAVTYLAELVGELPSSVALGSVSFDASDDDPLRAPWARSGGVANTVAWADEQLAAAGRPRTGDAEQIKSWNLSCVLRLPTASGDVWCKSVPRFLAHEGTIIGMVGAQEPTLVPRLVGADAESGTVLMEDVHGVDQWEAPEPLLIQMVRTQVRLQDAWADRTEPLIAAGLPDWRGRTLPGLLAAFAERVEVRGRFAAEELFALDALIADLPRRFAALAACGLPETLVHGDFHPGNWRFDGQTLTLLDWGDSGVGHPMFDFSAFDERVPDDAKQRVRKAWTDAWVSARPDSDPARAAELIVPISSLRRGLIYQGFLDGIEADERRYHDGDVPRWVRQALAEMEETGSS